MAVAVFKQRSIKGEVVFSEAAGSVKVSAVFTELPPGQHGFHIHKAGDLRGEGCKGACDHFHVGPPQDHGGPPGTTGPRHTGDLGNVSLESGKKMFKKTYTVEGIKVADLFGRSMIVHADPDDYGKGGQEDSLKTGHAGRRIGCAIIGRAEGCA